MLRSTHVAFLDRGFEVRQLLGDGAEIRTACSVMAWSRAFLYYPNRPLSSSFWGLP